MKQYAIPEYITASDIKRVRGKLGLTQAEFSKFGLPIFSIIIYKK